MSNKMQKFRFLITQTNFSLKHFFIFLFFVLSLVTSVNVVKALTTEEARWIDYPHTQETKAHTYAYAILPGRYKYISQDSALVQNVAGLCYYSGFYINTTAAGGVTDEYISADKFHYNPALIEMCGAMTADIYYDGIGWLYDNDWFND